MGYLDSVNDIAVGNGGAGTPIAWDIIDSTSHNLGGRLVHSFMSLDASGGTMTAMEEENPIRSAKKEAQSSVVVAAKYLTYTYPYAIRFEGRYTKLTPAASCKFKVWFLNQE